MPQSNLAENDPLIGAPKIWVAEFVTPLKFADFFTESLEEISIGVKCYEIIEDDLTWMMRIYFPEKPEESSVKARIETLANAVGLTSPEVKFFEIENKNWVLELAKEFKAIETSEFHIYSQFSEPSQGKTNIRINPGMAFGTGQHETTYLCLEAISWLNSEKKNFKNILDLGCGSGILAIAASKTWEAAKISASDNDPIAVEVSIENSEVNDCKMQTYVSEGYASIPASKFDLILANILMNPLLQLAPDMQKYSNGTLVLSGFKTDQTEELMAKYQSVGFTPIKIFVRNHWVAAILQK